MTDPTADRPTGESRVFTSTRARRQTVAWLLLVVLAVAGSLALQRRYLPWLTDATAVRLWVDSYGSLAPIAFVLVQAAQVVVAPIPGQVLGFVSGYLFGTLPGTVYSVLGATLGSYVVFRLSRRYGRPYVERVVLPTVVEQFDAIAERHGVPAVFLVFLVPGLPDDAICFAAGLTDLRIRDLVLVSAVGRLPGYLLVNAAGAQLAANRLTGLVVLVTVLVALSGLGYLWRGALLRRLGGRPD